MEWKPVKGLTLRTEGAYAISFKDENSFYAVGTETAKKYDNNPVASIRKTQTTRYIWTNTASYDWSLKEMHNFYFLLGQEIQNKESKYTYQEGL